jgi:hypothetical protein
MSSTLHSHDLDIALTGHLPLASAAADGKQSVPSRASPTTISRRPSSLTGTMNRPPCKSGAKAQFSLKATVLSLIAASPTAMAACISLQGSTTCPAFQSASVSTDPVVVGLLYVLFLPLTPIQRRMCPIRARTATGGYAWVLTRHSPFLRFVSSTSTFDQQMQSYVQTSYVQEK